MITTLLVNLASVFIGIVGAMTPAWKLPDYIIEPLTSSWSIIMLLNGYMPIMACVKVFLLILGFHITYFFLQFTISVVNWFRGAGEIKI